MQPLLKIEGDGFLLDEVAGIMADERNVSIALKGSAENINYEQKDRESAVILRDILISNWEMFLKMRAEQRERARQSRGDHRPIGRERPGQG